MKHIALAHIAKLAFIVAIASLGIAGIIGIASGALCSISTGGSQDNRTIEEVKSTPVASVHKVKVNTVSESITIREGAENEVKAHFYGTASMVLKNIPHLIVKQQDGVIDIYLHRKNERSSTSSRYDASLEITVPRGYDGDLSAESVSGNIVLGSHRYGTARLRTVSGNASADKMDVGKFSVNTISGSFSADELRCEQSDIDSISGNICVESFTGSTRIHTVSGDSTITCMTPSGSLSANTTSGSTTLYMPETSKFKLDAGSVSGSVNCDFPITLTNIKEDSRSHTVVGTVADGQIPILVHSVSGDVNIRKVAGKANK